MNLAETMTQLEQFGKANHRKVYPKHGVRGPMFGVSYADLNKLKKKIGTDHDLARELWDTGNHDARVLATMIADAGRVTAKELDAWIRSADNYIVVEALSGVAASSPHAQEKAEAWRKAKSEWTSAAGWVIVSRMATPGAATDAWLEARLPEIEKGIHAAPNRTRHSMNQALISIGGYRPALRERALRAAQKIGTVEVDHGATNCKTPAAAPYIEKMAKHHDRK